MLVTLWLQVLISLAVTFLSRVISQILTYAFYRLFNRPMSNWAVLTIQYVDTINATIIIVTTDVPCHLTCYYTDVKPERHRSSITRRGLMIPWGAYFCFVASTMLEQAEPGDTLTHTFTITNWYWCQIKWLIFKGTINGISSPSVTPIFQHHHPYVVLTLYEHYLVGPAAHPSESDNWSGQTFTPQISHHLFEVKFRVYRVGWPGIVTIDTYACDPAHKPTGSILSTGTFNGNLVTTNTLGEMQTIPLSFGCSPLSGVEYALIIKAPAGNASNYINMKADPSSTYTRGVSLKTWNGGATWSVSLTADKVFEEWGYPFTPAP